jgi:hypothetical protein
MFFIRHNTLDVAEVEIQQSPSDEQCRSQAQSVANKECGSFLVVRFPNGVLLPFHSLMPYNDHLHTPARSSLLFSPTSLHSPGT